MNPDTCFVCNITSVFYVRNLMNAKSQHSETRLCEFIAKFLGEFQSNRLDNSLDDTLICFQCLNKIDEYDLACVTAQRIEKELREVLLQTESIFSKETKPNGSCDLYLQQFELTEILSDEIVESKSNESDNERDCLKNDDNSDKDEDYKPMKQTRRSKRSCIGKQKPEFKCKKCDAMFAR